MRQKRQVSFQIGSGDEVRLTLIEGPIETGRSESGLIDLKQLCTQLDQPVTNNCVILALTNYTNGGSDADTALDRPGAEGSIILTEAEARRLRQEITEATLTHIYTGTDDHKASIYVGNAGNGKLRIRFVYDDFDGTTWDHRGTVAFGKLVDGLVPEGQDKVVTIIVPDLEMVTGSGVTTVGKMTFQRKEAMVILHYVISITMKEICSTEADEVENADQHVYYERLPDGRIRLVYVDEEEGSSAGLLERGTIDLDTLLEELRSFKVGCTLNDTLLTLEVSNYLRLDPRAATEKRDWGSVELVSSEAAALLAELER